MGVEGVDGVVGGVERVGLRGGRAPAQVPVRVWCRVWGCAPAPGGVGAAAGEEPEHHGSGEGDEEDGHGDGGERRPEHLVELPGVPDRFCAHAVSPVFLVMESWRCAFCFCLAM